MNSDQDWPSLESIIYGKDRLYYYSQFASSRRLLYCGITDLYTKQTTIEYYDTQASDI